MPEAKPTILIAGAGIGGLTAGLALAAHGYPVGIYEQASAMREGRVGRNGATEFGPEYNTMLSAFAEGPWRLKVAAAKTPSLSRARQRLAEFARLLKPRPGG